VGIIFSCINCETKPDRGKDEYSNVNENLLQNALDLSLGQGDGREFLIWGELLLTLQFFSVVNKRLSNQLSHFKNPNHN